MLNLQSSGRIERLIRTLREGAVKKRGSNIEAILKKIMNMYNNTFHSDIKCVPQEAMRQVCDSKLIVRNSRNGS